jgi:branched-chain amino acid transport system permease protein
MARLFERYPRLAGLPWVWIALAALFVAPFLSSSPYVIFVGTAAMYFATIVMALNVIVSAGVWHIGFAAFLALGGYTAGYFAKHLGVSLWLGIPLGALASMIVGVLLFIPTLRLHQHYLMIATLIIGVVAEIMFINLVPFTGGTAGMSGIPSIEIPWIVDGQLALTAAARPQQQYYVVLLGALITYLVVRRLDDSPLGVAMRAMREDDLAAQVMGHDTRRLRLLAVAVGSALVGMAGGILVMRLHAISPAASSADDSILFMTMLVVGGSGNIYGAMLGGALLSVLPQVLQNFARYRLLVYGLILLFMMLFRPQGVIPDRVRRLSLPAAYGPPPARRAREGAQDGVRSEEAPVG